jgi:hypothetical protein
MAIENIVARMCTTGTGKRLYRNFQACQGAFIGRLSLGIGKASERKPMSANVACSSVKILSNPACSASIDHALARC